MYIYCLGCQHLMWKFVVILSKNESFHIYAVCKAALKVPIATASSMQMTVQVVSCLFLLFIRHFVMWIYYIYGHRLEICMLHIV